MDVITAANKESALLTSLESNQVSDIYTYRLLANLPNASRNIWSVSPNIPPSGSPHSKDVTFKLPRYGLLQRAVIRTDMVTPVAGVTAWAGVDDRNIGERIFSDISLRAHSKVITTSGPQHIRCRVDNMSSEMAHTYSLLTQTFGSTGARSMGEAASTITTYTPVILPFFEKTSNYLDLEFIDQLELSCTVNTASEMGLAISGSALSSATFTLYLFFRNLSNEARRAYEAKNFSPERPLNMLIYDQYVERVAVPVGADGQSVTATMNVPHCVFATHFYISQGLDGATAAGVEWGPSIPIKSYSVSFTGRTILNSIPEEVMKYDGAAYNITGDKVTRAGAITKNTRFSTTGGIGAPSPISLYWSESNDRTYNSHAVAMSNINNPQLTVTCGATTAAGVLYIVHEYWKLLSISPDDGRLDVGMSL